MDLERLKKLAKGSTPGPWGTETGTYGHRITYIQSNYDFPSETQTAYLGQRDKLSDSYNFWNNTALFIAAANPSTVLKLIESIETARLSLENISNPVPVKCHFGCERVAREALSRIDELLGEGK